MNLSSLARFTGVSEARASEHALLHHVGQRHGGERHVNLPAEFLPQIMGETTRSRAGAAFRAAGLAARRADRLVDGEDNVGDAQFARRAAQAIATAGTA